MAENLSNPAPSPSSWSERICVGIATRGRPEQIRQVVDRLRRQTMRPASVIVVCVEPSDVAGLDGTAPVRIVHSQQGSSKQRNVVLDQAPASAEFVVFFDDDFIPDDRWLENAAALFDADPSVACITGKVVADGVLGPGMSYEEGEIALAQAAARIEETIIEPHSPYGCNMAFRASAIAGVRFDERLGLYAWQEDRDFGSRVASAGGRMVKLDSALGVHLGVKRGRVSGKKFGYSQIVNPYYLWTKGTISARNAIRLALRNVSANLAKSPWPEPYIDRRGRLLGNALGVVDLLKGVCEPERAELL